MLTSNYLYLVYVCSFVAPHNILAWILSDSFTVAKNSGQES